ncbi:MAG TPA: LamG-like jellyroll fold domain-containing protein [Bacteroidales bacterium]|nr:LamG-like jellyroll fold domain-containing protein [Bacteroidales bacterium]
MIQIKTVNIKQFIFLLILFFYLNSCKTGLEIDNNNNLLSISFDRKRELHELSENPPSLCQGISKKGIDLTGHYIEFLPEVIDGELFSSYHDFTVSVWLKSDNYDEDTCVILSSSDFEKMNAGIYGERRLSKGITLYSFNGRWGWNIGNGRVHYLYEPVYKDQPLSDGGWHNLSFTHDAEKKEIRLYYDGINKCILHIGDMDESDFQANLPLHLGEQKDAISGCESFKGIVDELNIWSAALASEDIKQLVKGKLDVKDEPELLTDTFTILDWNIWHGGTHFTLEEDGFDGIKRIIELIRESEADIVLMQETYGAGSEISSSLGFYYYEASSTIGAVWGANLSVMSRYPFEDAYMVEKKSNYGNNYAFNNGGAKIKLTDKKKIIAFSNWYNGGKPEDLEGVLNAWSTLISNSDHIPLIFGGDYNSESHLDDGIGESGHSKLMSEAGFVDALRKIYPDPEEYPGFSSPRGTGRIDYIYFKGQNLHLIDYKPIILDFKGRDGKTPGYPSDHLGIISTFKFN